MWMKDQGNRRVCCTHHLATYCLLDIHIQIDPPKRMRLAEYDAITFVGLCRREMTAAADLIHWNLPRPCLDLLYNSLSSLLHCLHYKNGKNMQKV